MLRNVYKLDSPPPAKRVAYPSSPDRFLSVDGPADRDAQYWPDLSTFACMTPSPAGSGAGTVDRNEEEANSEGYYEDDDPSSGMAEFGAYATCVRLSSTVPTNVVHKTLEADSGMESDGVSPLSSDDQHSQSAGRSSGGKQSPSMSALTDDEDGLACESSVSPGREVQASVLGQQQSVLKGATCDAGSSSRPSPSYLSVLSRPNGSWIGSSSVSPTTIQQ